MKTGAYLQKIVPMTNTKIVFYIYYILIISPGLHLLFINNFSRYSCLCVLHGFCKLLQENYLKNLF